MSIQTRIEMGATAILTICAVLVTTIVIRQHIAGPVVGGSPQPLTVRDWRKFATGNMRIGSNIAPVTIVEFSDFQCPFCERLYRAIDTLQATYPGQLAIVYRNVPLTGLHPFAMRAAMAAQCAADQGRFATVYNWLFSHQDSVGTLSLAELATRADVPDTTRFRVCSTGKQVRDDLAADSVAAVSLRVRGTPTFLVNDQLFYGMPPDSLLTITVRRALHSASRAQ
jgi:protein-disulfide isomerase